MIGRDRTVLLAVLVGCGDASSTAGGTDPSGTGGETSAGETGSDIDTGTTGAPEDDGTTTDDPGPILDGEIEVILHDSQPMVVDLRASFLRPATMTARVDNDAGARIESTTGDAPALEHVLRLRGLFPGMEHQVSVTMTDPGNETEQASVSFETLPALAGFQGFFMVDGSGLPSSESRIFDVIAGAEQSLFVVDNDGRTRWYWPSNGDATPAFDVIAGTKVLDDGSVMYLQSHGLEVIDELGQPRIELSSADLGIASLHHDVLMLPNGNFLALSFAFQTLYYPADGQDHDVGGDLIVEFEPDGKIVWTWNAFDHLDPQRKRDGFDGPYPITNPANGQVAKDWTHGNALIYEPATNSIVLSLRNQDWIIRISRDTDEVVWRLGDEGDFTLTNGTWFFHQHSPQWQPDGSLLLYDNGNGNPYLQDGQERSRPVRYTLDFNQMTATQAWDETNVEFISAAGGDADRLENGNVLVTDSAAADFNFPLAPASARVREVDPMTNEWVWSIDFPVGTFIYRAIPTDRLPGEAVN